MQPDGTFMITNNYLNQHSLPSKWNYNTFQYGITISFWSRIEIGYVCTIFNGAWDPRPEEEKGERWTIMRNQDRHFVGKICLLREGEFGKAWMPALVIGASDPINGDGFFQKNVTIGGNSYFNHYYAVCSKHFSTRWGVLGAHVGYLYTQRTDNPFNGPCAGIDWEPVWLQDKGLLDKIRVIAEYDSHTVNLGLIASIWNNRFEAMFDLQNFQWVSFGLRYKLQIKRAI